MMISSQCNVGRTSEEARRMYNDHERFHETAKVKLLFSDFSIRITLRIVLISFVTGQIICMKGY